MHSHQGENASNPIFQERKQPYHQHNNIYPVYQEGAQSCFKAKNGIEGAQHENDGENNDKGAGAFRIELHRKRRTGGKPQETVDEKERYGKSGRQK